jgi:hypothetical protein
MPPPLLTADTEAPALYLDNPDVRYADGPGGGTPLQARWIDTPGVGWIYHDARLALRTTLGDPPRRPPGLAGAHARLDLTATAVAPVRLAHCAIRLRSPSPSPPWCVDRFLRWRPVRDVVTVNEYAPLVVRWEAEGRAWELRATHGSVAHRVRWANHLLSLTLLLDAAALHPRWSMSGGAARSLAAPLWEPGHQVTHSLLLRGLTAAAAPAPVVAGRLPAGQEAAFTITDHPDFDTIDRLHAFLHGDGREAGWLGRGLRLTKGVFTLPSTPSGRPPAPSLADAPYRALIERLHGDGSEIAPHALNESGQLSTGEFRAALSQIVRDFAPRTWIDHGLLLDYCYYMDGGSRYALLPELRRHGVTTLWAYQDAPFDASTSLNVLAPVAHDLGATAWHAARHAGRRETLVAAHYVRTALRSHLRGRVGEAVASALSVARGLYMDLHRSSPLGASLRRSARELRKTGRNFRDPGRAARAEPYARRELVELAPLLFPERGAPLGQVTTDDLLLFVTAEVLHVRDAYSPEALRRLVAERGVHAGHSYLLNRLPYVAGVFGPSGSEPRLAPEWVEFVDALSGLVGVGRVWNPVMSELAEWIRTTQLVAVVPSGDWAVELRNPLAREVSGFTLLLPPATVPSDVSWGGAPPAGARQWHDWLAVWGDVPARQSVVVRWGAGQRDPSGSRGVTTRYSLPDPTRSAAPRRTEHTPRA